MKGQKSLIMGMILTMTLLSPIVLANGVNPPPYFDDEYWGILDGTEVSTSGDWSNAGYAIDGDASTSATCNSGTCDMYVNFTIPSGYGWDVYSVWEWVVDGSSTNTSYAPYGTPIPLEDGKVLVKIHNNGGTANWYTDWWEGSAYSASAPGPYGSGVDVDETRLYIRYYNPSQYTELTNATPVTVTGTWTNEANAYDGDFGTWATPTADQDQFEIWYDVADYGYDILSERIVIDVDNTWYNYTTSQCDPDGNYWKFRFIAYDSEGNYYVRTQCYGEDEGWSWNTLGQTPDNDGDFHGAVFWSAGVYALDGYEYVCSSPTDYSSTQLSNPTNAFDDDGGTYSDFSDSGYLYLNYTLNDSMICNQTMWVASDDQGGLHDIEMTDACCQAVGEDNIYQVRIRHQASFSFYYECWDGDSWENNYYSNNAYRTYENDLCFLNDPEWESPCTPNMTLVNSTEGCYNSTHTQVIDCYEDENMCGIIEGYCNESFNVLEFVFNESSDPFCYDLNTSRINHTYIDTFGCEEQFVNYTDTSCSEGEECIEDQGICLAVLSDNVRMIAGIINILTFISGFVGVVKILNRPNRSSKQKMDDFFLAIGFVIVMIIGNQFISAVIL